MKLPAILAILAPFAGFADELSGEFRVTSTFPKYVTADIEFRDPAGVKWPVFLYGKPATDTGAIALGGAKPAAAFALLCDKQPQDKGDQSRKVLGALPQPLSATLTIAAMSAPQPAAKTKGSKATHTADLTGTLEIAGRKIPVKATTGLWQHNGKGDEKNAALMLDGAFTVKAGALGIKEPAEISVRFGLTAYQESAQSKK